MTTNLTADQALAGAAGRHFLDGAGRSVEEVARSVVGLHATSPVGPVLSARARIAGFARRDLEAAMFDEWRLVRFRAMRLTMFVFPHEVLEIAAGATREIGRRLAARWLRDSGLPPAEFERLAGAIDDLLASGPRTVRGIRRDLGVPRHVDVPGVVGRMCDLGRLVGGAPPRSWRSPVRRYHRWRDVLPGIDPHSRDESASVRELIRRYISAYGPVTLNDISWWTGLTKTRSGEAVAALDDVEEVAVDGWPGPLLRCRAPVRRAGAHTVVLPVLDPYVQGYRDRDRFIDPALHEFVYDGGGNSAATIVADGRIIGVWQTSEDPDAHVRYHLFGRQPPSVMRHVQADLAAAGAMYFDEPVDVAAVRHMEPLSAGGGRSAMHPLDGEIHRASRRSRT
jgi:hypothetical protein